MKIIVILILCFFAVVLEATVTTIPFLLSVLLSSAVVYKKQWIFFIGFVAGVLLDALTFRPLGIGSIFFLLFLLLIFLYERKFETQTVLFVFFFSFFGSLFYLKVFGYHEIFLSALISTGITVGLFLMLRLLQGKAFKTRR